MFKRSVLENLSNDELMNELIRLKLVPSAFKKGGVVKKQEINNMAEENVIVDKVAYQSNRRYMAWTALATMLIATTAVLIWPTRFAEADSILMMMYGSLSALVGAYFGFAMPKKK